MKPPTMPKSQPNRGALPLKTTAGVVIRPGNLSPHEFWCRLLTLAKAEPARPVLHRGKE